jgi:hypothetical protein
MTVSRPCSALALPPHSTPDRAEPVHPLPPPQMSTSTTPAANAPGGSAGAPIPRGVPTARAVPPPTPPGDARPTPAAGAAGTMLWATTRAQAGEMANPAGGGLAETQTATTASPPPGIHRGIPGPVSAGTGHRSAAGVAGPAVARLVAAATPLGERRAGAPHLK